MADGRKEPVTGLPLARLDELLGAMGEPGYRRQQLRRWLYQKRVGSFDEMTNVPKAFRASMADRFEIGKPAVERVLVSESGDAAKFGVVVDGGDLVEAVLLYDGKRRTACISSQLGCGLGCSFCETGRMGFVRNLHQHEIVGQLTVVNDYLATRGDKLVTNIVFMGMGEALSNFGAFRSSVDVIMDGDCFNLGGRRITVSTAGVVPSIERLAAEGLNIGLAISLNTHTDEKRNRIMPVNRTHPIAAVVEAARWFAVRTGQDVTFEYVVVRGDNDGDRAVEDLARILHGVPCKINLIPVNPCSDCTVVAPSDDEVRAFADKLSARGIASTVRKSRGRDIGGACGQLAGRRAGAAPSR